MSDESLVEPAVKPKAFVLMPFSTEFDAIFETLIVNALMAAGFDAFRADNIKNQSNIMRDIINAIATSDLVIADLTSANPNVYYELGIAHGLQRPVVLLTQEISELPFDLKSYRVIGYGTHFSEMNRAREELSDLALEVGKGNVHFGSPVSDFLDREPHRKISEHRGLPSEIAVAQPEVAVAEPKKKLVEENLGFFDHLVDMEDSFGELTEIMNGIAAEMSTIGQDANDATGKVKAAQVKKKPGTAKFQRKVIRELGEKVEAFSQFIADSNRKYRTNQLKAQRSLEAVMVGHNLETKKNRNELRDFLDILNGLESSAIDSRASLISMAETMRGIDHVERTFSRASAQAANEIESLAENVDLTIALINRARENGGELLLATADEDFSLKEDVNEESDVAEVNQES